MDSLRFMKSKTLLNGLLINIWIIEIRILFDNLKKNITMIGLLLIGIMIIIILGKTQQIKSLIIGSSLNSLKHQYIARMLFSESEIKEVLSKYKIYETCEELETLDFSECDSNDMEIYDIDTLTIKGHAIIVYHPELISIGYSKYLEKGEKTSEMAKRNNAQAAINGGGFKYGKDSKEPMGVIIHNEKVIYNELKDENIKQDIVGFTRDGMLIVGKHSINDLKRIGIKEAVTFGPPLIVNGKKVDIEGDGGWGIAPGTAIGQRENGTVILMTLQGRSLKTIGATIKDVQEQMIKLGAINATNLDGGNSSTMIYKGNILNKKEKKEIEVPTAILVKK